MEGQERIPVEETQESYHARVTTRANKGNDMEEILGIIDGCLEMSGKIESRSVEIFSRLFGPFPRL